MFKYILIIFFLILLVPNAVLAQQASMVWDEKSKSWVSTPAAATTPAPTPQIQTQLPQQQPTQTYIQTQPVTAAQSNVDLGTLMTVITPILAGIAGIFVKNRKDMEKKTEETKNETIKTIQEAIAPHLKQITPVAEQTAKQDVKIQQLAEEMYKLMAEKANEIHDKPEIKQQTLIEDAVKSKMIAEQTKTITTPSMQWDDVKKEWVSK
jgi:hypothetical protein